LLEGGLLIVQAGGAKGALLALDAASGKENWRWKGDSSAYSSPVIGTFGGTKQVVFLTADQVVGVDLSNGTLAWKTPLRTSMMQSNMMTPVIADGTVIYSGENKGVTAARPKRDQNGAWSLEQVWLNAEVSFTMSSPVRTDRLLFGMTPRNKGQLVCLDPTSGKTLWKGPPRQGENAALLLLDTFLLTLTNEGQLILMKPSGDSYQEVRRHQVANTETWAHPIPTAQGVIVKDLDSVALWQ
ncbi:MAG: PQQ-like beta-propeller repeat protein, partial [Bryobacteraceae bacterium]|nr:PQQ-like beta-propeller repeat protein [Bryobacteraceae bacterium]